MYTYLPKTEIIREKSVEFLFYFDLWTRGKQSVSFKHASFNHATIC